MLKIDILFSNFMIIAPQVLMKDVATPATQSEVRGTIKEALTKAALVNYERLSEEARIEGKLKD